MGIRTYQSFSGYVATDPSIQPTPDGTPRFYARAGQRQAHREPDGTFTAQPTQYMPILAFGAAAEEAALLARGDSFVAEGRIRTVSYDKNGTHVEGEEFEIFKIGRRPDHPETDRSRPTARTMPSREVPAEFTAAPASSAQVAARGL
ncbi:single-stranded DNA-binding protein [Microbacterium hominis]|uniref:single-stranded DNA-binding protein n=1 Tax=Microbacterium hominis TaxID=162426 RepID=UPI001964FC64|nr:single-stranded DNA-binding protein [Microbacterium hominis]QRY41417.1 single-stranded DNA-binding protein [Microbacterium hominis]